MASLADDLKTKVINLVSAYNPNDSAKQKANRMYIRGGWLFDQYRFANEASAAFNDFLFIAQDHKADLATWTTPVAVASAMQTLYVRLVWLWQGLPEDLTKLPQELSDTINSEVPQFAQMVSK